MASNFLKLSQARTISLAQVLRMSDQEAYDAFKAIRFAENSGEPFCPKCGITELYALPRRKVWRCKAIECGCQFSVTSGTIFASRKLSIRDILAAIAIFVNGAKGHAALHLSRDLDVQHKTAFVLCHKLREAIGSIDKGATVSGTVEIDGMHVGGYIKPANRKDHRKDRRLAYVQNGKRQVVIAARERNGKTITFATTTEGAGVAKLQGMIEAGSTVHADEAAHWDVMHARFETKRINHSEAYSADGACTNQVESFFSRLRRAEIGTHHHIAGPYLAAYAAEMDWREDARRESNGAQYLTIVKAAAAHPISRQWKGYWQRRRAA